MVRMKVACSSFLDNVWKSVRRAVTDVDIGSVRMLVNFSTYKIMWGNDVCWLELYGEQGLNSKVIIML